MIQQVMMSRRSVRRFTSDIPSRDLVERLIEAAISAPSASNKQPWRFIAVTNKAVIDRMEKAVRDALADITENVETDYRSMVQSYVDYFTGFDNAGLIIVPMYRSVSILSKIVGTGLLTSYRVDLETMERDSGLISVSLALQNLLLMVHELGLGATCMTGPLVARQAINHILDIPLSWNVVALVPVGYPDEVPRPTSRKPVGKVLRWID